MTTELTQWLRQQPVRPITIGRLEGPLLRFVYFGVNRHNQPFYRAMSRRGNFDMGIVRWSPQCGWAFFGDAEAAMTKECLAEAYAFIKTLREAS